MISSLSLNKLLVLALACLVHYTSAKGRYNIAVLYHMKSWDSDCHDVSDRLFRVTTLSLIKAGIDLDDDPEHWESYVTDHTELVEEENKKDKAALMYNHANTTARELIEMSKYTCRMFCSATGIPTYCQCCGDLCGGMRRRLKYGLRKGNTDNDMEKVVALAEKTAVEYLNQWHYPIKCLRYDDEEPHYRVTVKMELANNGNFKDKKDEPCCPAGHSGLLPYNDCTQFISCDNGVVRGTQDCNKGLLFDPTSLTCNFAAQVQCKGEPVC